LSNQSGLEISATDTIGRDDKFRGGAALTRYLVPVREAIPAMLERWCYN